MSSDTKATLKVEAMLKIKLVVFDVRCFFAHFRKHFSTTSSLSYSFPPRTAIAGLIAAMLGYDRDSYYLIFSSNKCRIALQLKTPVRHLTATLNYLMTDKPLTLKKLKGTGGSMPVHLDVLVSGERRLSPLSYRIFFGHEDDVLFKEVEERVKSRRFSFPPYLGTANNLTEVEYIDTVEADFFRANKYEKIETHTVAPLSAIKNVIPEYDRRIHLEELVPADFTEDRTLKREENYIYEECGKPIKVLTDREFFTCILNGDKVAGFFM